eukprot:Gb_02541 [translate_table: standard]
MLLGLHPPFCLAFSDFAKVSFGSVDSGCIFPYVYSLSVKPVQSGLNLRKRQELEFPRMGYYKIKVHLRIKLFVRPSVALHIDAAKDGGTRRGRAREGGHRRGVNGGMGGVPLLVPSFTWEGEAPNFPKFFLDLPGLSERMLLGLHPLFCLAFSNSTKELEFPRMGYYNIKAHLRIKPSARPSATLYIDAAKSIVQIDQRHNEGGPPKHCNEQHVLTNSAPDLPKFLFDLPSLSEWMLLGLHPPFCLTFSDSAKAGIRFLKMGYCKIKVHLRIKPSARPSAALHIDAAKSIVRIDQRHHEGGPPKHCSEQHVFPMDNIIQSTSQEAVFEQCAKKMVEEVLSGYNGTLMAYGQSGSGKTFTMTGEFKASLLFLS